MGARSSTPSDPTWQESASSAASGELGHAGLKPDSLKRLNQIIQVSCDAILGIGAQSC